MVVNFAVQIINMKTLKFKSNIKCDGCIAKVTPFLNNEKAIKSWSVDIFTPEKILTVETELDAGDIEKVIEKAGYRAQSI